MSVLDGLAEYLEANDSLAELEGFIRQLTCEFREAGEEQPLECFAAYRGYEERVRAVLADFVEVSRRDLHLVGLSGQVTVEGLVQALRGESAASRPGDPGRLLRALLAVTDYEEFANEARRLRPSPRIPVPAAAAPGTTFLTTTVATDGIFMPWASGPGIAGMADVVRAGP
mmetsp:Transcript_95510/g.269970  ORF Transcript_95510/g.269970 Transcript_95510/m.269970 type:complete len:171 (-) Transcript_95510:123-635(-)